MSNGHIGDKETAFADGNVFAARIITLPATAKPHQLRQATAATQFLVGISDVGTRVAPREDLTGTLPLAADLEQFKFIAGAGKEAKLEAGAAVASGVLITTDTNGKGILASVGENVIGYNMGDAVVAEGDELRIVLVSPGVIAP